MTTAAPTGADLAARVPLTRDRILATAVALADEAGIESLTMRRLARALGVEAMSLYNHVANKDAILDGIVDLVVSEIALPTLTEPWDVAVRRCAISAHAVYLRHRWACALAMSPTTGRTARGSRMRYIESLLGCLRHAGFTPRQAYQAYHALDSHILGFTIWQIGHSFADDEDPEFVERFLATLDLEGFPYLLEHLDQHLEGPDDDGATEFEFGLELIVAGLSTTLRAAADALGDRSSSTP
jgi:AcrR family transcriptional regulator